MRKYINDAHLAKRLGRTRWERISVFFDLIKLRVMRRLAGGVGLERKIRLLRYDVWGFSYATLDFLYREIFLAGEYFFETADSRPVIVDCGANVGMAALYFKYLFPEARIVAFEANPSAFRLLQRNMETNGIRDVDLHNVALSDREGEISFFISSDPGTLLGSTRRDMGGNVELKAKADRLSKYIQKYPGVELVKIDVEGSELSIVNELAQSSTLGKANQYIVEYHHRINEEKSGLGDFLKKFEMAGYDYKLSASYSRVRRFQNILIHFYKDVRTSGRHP